LDKVLEIFVVSYERNKGAARILKKWQPLNYKTKA